MFVQKLARALVLLVTASALVAVPATAEAHHEPRTPVGGPWRGSVTVLLDTDVVGRTMYLDFADAEGNISDGSETCTESSGKVTATTAGPGLISTSNTGDKTYGMPVTYDYSMKETCTGWYTYWPGWGPERTCSYSAATDTEVHGYTPDVGLNSEANLRLTYGERWWAPGEPPVWSLTFRFAPPGEEYSHTVTDASDSCGNLTVHPTGPYGFGDLIEGQVTGPAPGALVSGVSTLEGSGLGSDTLDVPHSWSFTYYGPEASKPGAPIIGVASSGKAGRPINATTRWSAPADDGGSQITAYKVQAQKLNTSGGVVRRFNATRVATARTLTMVLPRGRYKFRVAAVNSKGTSAWSSNSSIVRAR